MRFPIPIFLLSFFIFWLTERIGISFRRRKELNDDAREDFSIILTAALTMLGLMIGFTFSMAVSRFDQRKYYEEAEANAIGTEYFRAGLLPSADAAKVRGLLRSYLNQRILFYDTRDARQLQQTDTTTTQLQNDLWSSVQTPAATQPTPVVALAVGGMNDVLNSQGYTQFAWSNRIPIAAWLLLGAVAVCGHLMVGYNARHPNTVGILLLTLPLLVSISFLLIADIDSPRGGLIRIHPVNLVLLSHSLQTQ
jgi:hypothetical protein